MDLGARIWAEPFGVVQNEWFWRWFWEAFGRFWPVCAHFPVILALSGLEALILAQKPSFFLYFHRIWEAGSSEIYQNPIKIDQIIGVDC